MKRLVVDSLNERTRLDMAVQGVLTSLSRSHIQKLIESGKITVNGQVEKTGYKLKATDEVEIDFDEKELLQIPKIDLPIIYEDDDCLVINKPVGILTHSKGAFNPEATVASFIAPKLKDIAGERAGIVHRLDRATSGVIICAKNEESQKWLQKQFAQRKTKKTYVAVIKAGLEPKTAVIDMPIERDPKHPKQFRVGSNGRSAQTAYKIEQEEDGLAVIELKPTTGRTHQLRVHLKQLGYPIVGDELYGGAKADRLMLHAESLELTLPSRERKTFSAPVPADFKAIMK